MNELQIALLGAGILAVIGVWIYNAWQERKHRKLAEAIFKGEQDDVLLRAARPVASAAAVATPVSLDNAHPDTPDVERREPGIGGLTSPVDSSAETADEDAHDYLHTARDEPLSTPTSPSDAAWPHDQSIDQPLNSATVSASAAAESASRNERRTDDLLPWADPLADCLVSFVTHSPVLASGIQAAQGSLHNALSKPVHWLARQDEMSPWFAMDGTSTERYAHWLVALQLVDRRGAISDAELGRFLDGLRQVAHHLGIQIEFPSRSEMFLRAQELDRFCASVDIQFALSVVNAQGGAFAGTKLRGVCEAAGLTLERDGLYHYRNAAGESEFALGNLGNEPFDPAGMSSLATHGVSLFIDVPRVSDGTASFNRMVLVARQLAQGLGATLVDANRAPLSEQMITTIRNKISELQHVLNKAGITPGGPRAMRLFS